MHLMFVHIQKTAGLSIRSALRDLLVGAHHLTYLQMVSRYGSAGHRFTVVRNPYERLLSFYLYVRNIPLNSSMEIYGELARHMTFGAFASYIIEYERKYGSVHFSECAPTFPQYPRLLDENGEVGVNTILRYESLESDWYKFLRLTETPFVAIPTLNTSRVRPTAYPDYYDESTRQLVYEIYKDDFVHLRYPEAYPCHATLCSQ